MAALVEKLVKLIARAYYTDESIVVLQALIREKFLKDDEMGNAIHLQTRQVRRILADLQKDHLVSTEILNDKRLGGNSSMTYWYIDYKYFVDVVKYRLYKINELLKEKEQNEIEKQMYKCNNISCGKEYTSLEAQRLIVPGKYHFCCGHCGEVLFECDNHERLEHIQQLQKKFQEQINKNENLHEGITETIRRIGDYMDAGHTLPRNLPSENRAAGVGGTSIRGPGGNGQNTTSRNMLDKDKSQKKDGVDIQNQKSYLYSYGSNGQEIVVNIANTSNDDFMLGNKRKTDEDVEKRPTKHVKTLPEFLRGSTITGHLNKKEEILEKKHDKITFNDNNIEIDDKMTEEERQEAFKTAYMAELARYTDKYNLTNHINDKEIEIQLSSENDLKRKDDEEIEEGIEWEYVDEKSASIIKNISKPSNLKIKQILFKGHLTDIDKITENDLYDMNETEFISFYKEYLTL